MSAIPQRGALRRTWELADESRLEHFSSAVFQNALRRAFSNTDTHSIAAESPPGSGEDLRRVDIVLRRYHKKTEELLPVCLIEVKGSDGSKQEGEAQVQQACVASMEHFAFDKMYGISSWGTTFRFWYCLWQDPTKALRPLDGGPLEIASGTGYVEINSTRGGKIWDQAMRMFKESPPRLRKDIRDSDDSDDWQGGSGQDFGPGQGGFDQGGFDQGGSGQDFGPGQGGFDQGGFGQNFGPGQGDFGQDFGPGQGGFNQGDSERDFEPGQGGFGQDFGPGQVGFDQGDSGQDFGPGQGGFMPDIGMEAARDSTSSRLTKGKQKETVVEVQVQKKPHLTSKDEYVFTDIRGRTRSTLLTDWTTTTLNGRRGYLFQGVKTSYFTRHLK